MKLLKEKYLTEASAVDGAELIYEDNDWEVWIPKTHEASQNLGKNTNWSIASTNDYYFDGYTEEGPLYININKHNLDDKYLFHFPSRQFLNSRGWSIDLEDFITKHSALEHLYDSITTRAVWRAINNGDLPYYNEQGNITLSRYELGKALSTSDISSDAIEKFLTDDIFDWFWGDGYWPDDDEIESYYLSDIDTDNLNKIKEFGYAIETYEDWDDDLKDAVKRAVSDALNVGSENEATRDFDNAIEKAFSAALKNGEKYNWDHESGDIIIQQSNKVSPYYLIQNGDTDPTEIYLDKIADDWKFHEPQYGWNNFDEESFNMYLSDLLAEYEQEHKNNN